MPQAHRIRPRAHGQGHFQPGTGAEMDDWRPEQFVAARTQLASCEDCQACLFESDGEDAGHLYEEAAAAIAGEQVDRKLSLIARHLRQCPECAQAIFEAEEDDSESGDGDTELDFDDPNFIPDRPEQLEE